MQRLQKRSDKRGAGSNKRRRPKRQKNQPVLSTGSRKVHGLTVKEWQKTPVQLLRETCQQKKRLKPIFHKCHITNEDLQKYSKDKQISSAKVFRQRVVLTDKGNDRSKDLSFATKELHSSLNYAKEMSALLALKSICGSLPLERKLPMKYANIWQSLQSQNDIQQNIHALSKFKSKHEQQFFAQVKLQKNKKYEKRREIREFFMNENLDTIFMSEKLRIFIQQALRMQYTEIHKNMKNMHSKTNVKSDDSIVNAVFASMDTFLDMQNIESRIKTIDIELQKNTHIFQYTNEVIRQLMDIGFHAIDCKHAVYLTVAVDLLNNKKKLYENEEIIEESGTKVVKLYQTDDIRINVNKYISECVTWLCLHAPEERLPYKYAAKGKQFEILVSNEMANNQRMEANDYNNNRRMSNSPIIEYVTEGNTININNASESKSLDGELDVLEINDQQIVSWLAKYGFPITSCIESVRTAKVEYSEMYQYLALGYLYKKLISFVNIPELNDMLTVDYTETDVDESEEIIESEMETLQSIYDKNRFEFQEWTANEKYGKYKDFCWKMNFEFDDGKKGVLEIYRIMGCKGLNIYPKQMPIIVFQSPNNSISSEKCMQIIQCLIQCSLHLLGSEMSFEIIDWIQDNVQQLLDGNQKEFVTHSLTENWETANISSIENVNREEMKQTFSGNTVGNEQRIAAHDSSSFTNNPTKKVKSVVHKLFSIQKEFPFLNDEQWNISMKQQLFYKENKDRRYLDNFKKIRESLPAFTAREKIIELLTNNQVIVISGETGCGKSTQIPQFILDHEILNNHGSVCNIIVTQPRRISAVGLAERVSQERCEKVGNTVGYSIRLESKTSQNTCLLYCTTGILLRRLMSSLTIDSVSHVIIDEVHERSTDIDFLLVILKQLISQKRKDLKLVLMSATLDADLFSNYFNNCPVLKIPGRTFPVEELFLEDLLFESRVYLPKNCKWNKLGVQGQKLRYQRLKESPLYNISMNDECVGKAYPDYILRQISKWDERDNHQIEPSLVVQTIMHILTTHPLPIDSHALEAILCFLPGMYEIIQIERQLKEILSHSQRFDLQQFLIIILHSDLATSNQRTVFQYPPTGVRKIVLATNIAETSITIPDVRYVIDCGKMREMNYNADSCISVLSECWIAKAHASQRKGRAGRIAAGWCYKLYTRNKQISLMENPIPELMRCSLESIALQIKLLCTLSQGKKYCKKLRKMKCKPTSKVTNSGKIKNILQECIQPPTEIAIQSAISQLTTLGALDINEMLTPLGFYLAKLPINNIRIGKMLIYGVIFGCITPILIISAILTCKSFYMRGSLSAQLKKQFYQSKSDHMTAYKIFCTWKRNHQQCGMYSARTFAYNNGLKFRTLQQIDGIIFQYQNALKEIQFLDSSYSYNNTLRTACYKYSDRNSSSPALIKSVMVAGLYPNLIRIQMPKKKYVQTITGAMEETIDVEENPNAIRFYLHPKYFTSTQVNDNDNQWNNGRIFIHRQSLLHSETNFECKWLIYLTKIEVYKLFAYDVSMINRYSLLLFGGDIEIDHERGHIIVDNWPQARFLCPGRIAVLVKELKKMLNYLLMKKITNPVIDISENPCILAIEKLLKFDGFEPNKS